MDRNFVRLSMIRRTAVTLLGAVFFVAMPAHANEDAAQRAAFTEWRFSEYDVPVEYGGVPLNGVRWRLVESESEMGALSGGVELASGETNEEGEILLSDQQRQAMFDTWKRVPDKLWLVHGHHADQIKLVKTPEKYVLVLTRPEPEWERERRLAREQAAQDRNTPLPPSIFTQAKFESAPFIRDYSDWQKRFEQDADDMVKAMRSDPQIAQKLAGENATEVLDRFFARSVHNGEKGRAFKMLLVSDFMQRNHSRMVTSSGAVVTQLLLSPHARPVGFGGAFTDGDSSVELWFMVFDDLSGWSVQDFKESLVFSAFSHASLPDYRRAERDSWPALVFIRDENGKVMMYGLSRELARIIQSVFQGQVF